jgi:hypothetical protein
MNVQTTRSLIRRVLVQTSQKQGKYALPLATTGTRHMSAATSSASQKYVSPYHDFFQSMQNTNHNNGSITKKEEEATESTPTLKCGIPESVLKFKTTCYDRLRLPPFVQTNEYKVTLKVKVHHLPFETEQEMLIFKQVVGNRYNEELGELKLTSNQFASRIENKRHLCWMLDRIVLGCKGLAVGEES